MIRKYINTAINLLHSNYLVWQISKANHDLPMNREVLFPYQQLELDGIFPLWCEEGQVPGIVGVRTKPTVEALQHLYTFAKQGGKLFCLPMFAGIPIKRHIGMFAATTNGSTQPPAYMRPIPYLQMVDGEFF